MKYKPEEYIDSGFYGGDMDSDIENIKSKVVKCRKPHRCVCGCETEIGKGDYALLESGFTDGKPVSVYTSTQCIDKWLDEISVKEA